MTEIIPAILTNDISDFKQKYSQLFSLSHFFTKLHVDFIDGDFLPNKTIEVKDLIGFKSPLTLIAHFMTNNPKDYFADAKQAGFTFVSFHFEAFELPEDIQGTLDEAKQLGLKVGIAINPETKLFEIAKFIPQLDFVQLMAIHPGAQGRKFDEATLDKIRELRNLSGNAIICIDGGVKSDNVAAITRAGANWLVAGSAIWKTDNQKLAIEALKAQSETNI